MKIDSFLFTIKNLIGNIVFTIRETIKDIKNEKNKKRKPPSITKVISSMDEDDIFKGFEIEIEEEWLERGRTQNGKWKC